MSGTRIMLLMTATVDPGEMAYVKRHNPLDRENDYIIAINRWANATNVTMVFCENSKYQSAGIKNAIKNIGAARAELLSFNGLGYPKNRGKGYGELLILRHALQHSEKLRNADHILKVTGRYFIKNGRKVIDALSRNKNVFVMADLRQNAAWADSHIFACAPLFISEYLARYQDMIDDSRGRYLEHALAIAIHRALADDHCWLPLPVRPVVQGISGTSNTPYRNSKIRVLAAGVLHRLKNHLNHRH